MKSCELMKSCSSATSTSATSSSGEFNTDNVEAGDNGVNDFDLCSLQCLANCLSLPSAVSDQFGILNSAGNDFDYSHLSNSSNGALPFIRLSLFKNTPPTIYFYTKGVKVKKPPACFVSQLNWCNNSLLALVVRQSLSSSHFKLVNETKPWIGYWGRHLKSAQFKTLKPNQKVNHFPGAFHLGRKDRLWLHLFDMMQRFEDSDFCIMPFTYILPRDAKKLRAYLSIQNVRHVIIKPPASARGAGISIVSRFNMIPAKTHLVAQHYIENPLLINSAKFDLRVYVYVTSYDPLRIYLYEEGLVRFAAVPYNTAIASYSNQFMHLTNYSINKLAQQSGTSEEPVPKWSLTEFWAYLDRQGYDSATLKQDLSKVAVKAVISCESHIRAHAKHYIDYPFVSHELYGMDVLIDDNLRPWLVEMNISPSLHSATPLDGAVKAPLAKDTLTMCGIPFPISHENDIFSSLYFLTRNLKAHKSTEHILREQTHLQHFNENAEIREDILDQLSDADVRILVEFEDEFARKGAFRLVYPTGSKDSLHYLRCMKSPLYSNILLAFWQQLSAKERALKMRVLQKHCSIGFHIAKSSVEREKGPIKEI